MPAIIIGDCLDVLNRLDTGSVQTCITSPPYFGLRDYGTEGQIGLEATPDEYVAKLVEVFGEVKRVLRDDGTLWLNLGDSYGEGKQLLGMPWRVAKALQEPHYTGAIRDERDRIWLAAMIDAEGCIFIHKRKAGQSNGQCYERKNATYGSGLEVSSTDRVIVERILAITGRGSICEQGPDQNARRKQTLYRWNLRSNECRDVICEVYPHLVAKQQHEARLAVGCPSSGPKAALAHESLKAIHQGEKPGIDFAPPASMFEAGWCLRSEIIWAKLQPNPMPESVTDRPTKAHEQVFLLSKSSRYYYDASAIAEPLANTNAQRTTTHYSTEHYGAGNGGNGGLDGLAARMRDGSATDRNKRSVWTVARRVYPDAHFATFPPKLIEPMILAGCPRGGLVLDPFAGSGTTLQVALTLGREAIGIELNPKYAALIERRLVGVTPSMFDAVVRG